jgi:hypothetical protein
VWRRRRINDVPSGGISRVERTHEPEIAVSRTVLPLAVVLPLTLAAVACGGGPKHIGEITPVVQTRISGAWTLNEDETDDPQEALERSRADRGTTGRPTVEGGGGARGGMPGAGGRGGMTGTGGRGAMPAGARGGRGERAPAAGRNPDALRATMRLVTVPPRRMQVTLTDSVVTVEYSPSDVWVLPFGDKVKKELADDLTLEAKAEWENDRLIIRRSVSGGGSVVETFMPAVDGSRLTVAVEASLGGPGGGVEIRRVYDPGGTR